MAQGSWVRLTPFLPSLARERLREVGLEETADLRPIHPDGRIAIGSLTLEFIRVCHSIPDGVAVAARTPAGLVVHTGDFKGEDRPGADREAHPEHPAEVHPGLRGPAAHDPPGGPER